MKRKANAEIGSKYFFEMASTGITMNRYAYRTTGLAIKTLSALSRASVSIHGKAHIPTGAKIFVINHFTRIETLLLPYHIYELTKQPVWSLASHEFFGGSLGDLMEKVGAVSTKDPHRDRLIVKSLLTGEASWIIFPEGRMVKNKRTIDKGRFMVSHESGQHPPHSGAATLAIRAEFYRLRLNHLIQKSPGAVEGLLHDFGINRFESITKGPTYIVPVNLTYYPLNVQDNVLSHLIERLVDDVPERVVEEFMTEGTMLLSGVGIDMRFGPPIDVAEYLKDTEISKDIETEAPIGFDTKLASVVNMRKAGYALMHRYMRCIYGLTTVNIDHLAATLFLVLPGNRLDIAGFKKRLFWLCVNCRASTDLYWHHSLQSDPIALLTDDRHGWIKDFFDLAVEKGLITITASTVRRNKSGLSQNRAFHRARIDNPITVVANEVKPISYIQSRARRIAWAPGFMINRRISRYLMRTAEEEFQADYARHFIEGETKASKIGRPLLIKGRRHRRIGVLLLHGYMAAPEEVKALAGFISKRCGVWVYIPRLRGHGTSPEDLGLRSYKEWIISAEHGYGVISSICDNIIVGGFSTGAALALELATRIDGILGLFAVSTPLRLQYVTTKFAPAVDMWNRLMGKMQLEGAKMEFVENKPENPHINYLRNPVAGVRELERLMSMLEPKLESIQIPTLVVQDAQDPVVDEKGSKRIFELLGSNQKKYVLFHLKRHGILNGPGSEQVFSTIALFVEQMERSLLTG